MLVKDNFSDKEIQPTIERKLGIVKNILSDRMKTNDEDDYRIEESREKLIEILSQD